MSLPNGKTGLVHISEIADAYVKDINDYVKRNDRVRVKVLSVDPSGTVSYTHLDLLLEIGLYATIAGELGDFTFKDVLDGISDKLIRRHPHVFGGRDAGSPEQVEKLWAEIKRKEPGRYARGHSLMDEVDKGLPALMRAQKQQAVAARAGFDWPDVNGVFDKVQEEMSEIKEAYDKGNKTEVMDEVGDLLFACVNLARHLGVNAEVALLHTVEKFSRRFRQIESYLKSRSLRMEEMGLDVLDELWEKAKEAEAKEGE